MFRTLSLALLLSTPLTQLYAADPEFKVGVVTASRVYERERGSVAIGGIKTAGVTARISRVTVAVDGEHITGEWEPKTSLSATANDFPRGSEVSTAVKRSDLLLKHTDGSTVTAKIVRRERPKEPESRN
jgi:hypothetical protein